MLVQFFELRAEPWIDTRDEFLRADIEILADIGVIKVPISTYPLMWAGIIRDLDSVKSENIPMEYRDAYWRVKNAGRRSIGENLQQLKFSASDDENVIRSFGDTSRAKAEISARKAGLNKYFAWNAEVTYADDPQDGDGVRIDGSYLSTILGNWSVTLGSVEKWWGPSWGSNNLLSNNARPPLGVSLQRNYSDVAESPLFKWLGPWKFNTFVAELNDDRVVDDTKLIGASFIFKPVDSLEIGLRSTGLWGGEGRTESLSSYLDVLLTNEVCGTAQEEIGLVCDRYYSESGSRVGGIDFRWRLPLLHPISVYGSSYTEEEDGFFSSKSMVQAGLTSSFNVGDSQFKWFVEFSDTTLADEFNTAYEHPLYQTGYRFRGRNIGSSFDNDSETKTFGLLVHLDRYNKVSLNFTDVDVNIDNDDVAQAAGGNSHSANQVEVNMLKLKWQYKTKLYGKFDFIVEHFDEEFGEVESSTRIEWTFDIDE